MKNGAFELTDGSFDDVRSVFDGLSDAEKELVLSRGRTSYRDRPGRLAGRTVAYDRRGPVGFADIYGFHRDGRVRASPSIIVAVDGRARGRGLARDMVNDAMRKVLRRVDEIRRERGHGAGNVRRFVWRLHNGNEASASAARRAGFQEQLFRRPHTWRQFVMDAHDVER